MGDKTLVLAVDDEPGILKLIQLALEEDGFEVIGAASGEEALRRVKERSPDVVLLDILMPGMDGTELFARLRAETEAPVIFITAKNETGDMVDVLDLGADDYMVKPFNPDELSARIRAVLRRSGDQAEERVVRGGALEVYLDRRLVYLAGEPLDLSANEWHLLQYLANNAGKPVLSRELLSGVWGTEYQDDMEYLRVWVSRLRRKLEREGEPSLIKTLPRVGYMLDAKADATASERPTT